MSIPSVVFRAARLRCPRCGQGRLFLGAFRMRDECDRCGLSFAREPGYFLGSIYFNYGLTALLTTAAFFIGFFVLEIPDRTLLWSLAGFCVLFPLWFFRYARALWMGFDEMIDPQGRQDVPR